MSALALLAAGLGAEVGGSDLRPSRFTPLLEAAGHRRRDRRAAGRERAGRRGGRLLDGSAAGNLEVAVAGRLLHRGELLAEIVAARPSIVVGGTHGKTTTAAMIAFCLAGARAATRRSSSAREVPQLGGNARAGEGWLVTEGDEADRSIELLRPTIAVLTNVDFDHHTMFASRAEVEQLFERWLVGAGKVVRGDELEPVDVELAVPGLHNRRNAAAALAALELVGVAPDRGAAAFSPRTRARATASSCTARQAASRWSATTGTTRPRSGDDRNGP